MAAPYVSGTVGLVAQAFPWMTGKQLADQAIALRPQLRVLYTSGYTDNAIVHQGRLDPGVHLLTKPYRREELARRVRDAMSCRAAPAATI